MNTIDRHRYDMLVRVRNFGAEHGDLFPDTSLGGQTFAALASAVGQLSDNIVAQTQGLGATRSGSLSKASARTRLRAALDTIATTATAMAPGIPGLQGKFEKPFRQNDLDLVATAQSFIRDAGPVAAQFVAHRLPSTFLADLQSAIDDFLRAADARVAGRKERASSQAGIVEAFKAGFAALGRLDAIVPNALSDQPTVLAAWNTARRVDRVRTTSARPAPGPASAPTPPAAAEPPHPVTTGPAAAPGAVSASRA